MSVQPFAHRNMHSTGPGARRLPPVLAIRSSNEFANSTTYMSTQTAFSVIKLGDDAFRLTMSRTKVARTRKSAQGVLRFLMNDDLGIEDHEARSHS